MQDRKRYFTAIIAAALVILAFTSSISCQENNKTEKEKKPVAEKHAIRVEYSPKPAVKDSALSFRVYLPFNAKRVVLQLQPNRNTEKKEIILKKINPKEFAGIVIAFEEGVYRLLLKVTDEKSSVRIYEEGLPLVHVMAGKEEKKSDMDLILEYLEDYYSLLPSNYREIKIKQSEIAARKGKRILYRVIFEAKKYEEGRLKETETLFFVINKEAGVSYIEYAEKNPPPDFY